MASHRQYSTYGYGYGYWNEYGVTSQAEEDFENTSYHVFPPEHEDLHGAPFMTTSMPWEDHTFHNDPNSDSSTNPNGKHSEVHFVLEFLENLYFESHDLFKKVSSELHKKYMEKKFNKGEKQDISASPSSKFFKKVPNSLQKKKLGELKVQTMRRSLSLGSPRTPPLSGENPTLKLQRFKIKTLDLGGVQVQDDRGTVRFQN